jgi:hypothetical protein
VVVEGFVGGNAHMVDGKLRVYDPGWDEYFEVPWSDLWNEVRPFASTRDAIIVTH